MTPESTTTTTPLRPDSRRSDRALREILKDTRRQQGLSQMELALRLGYSPRHISFVENGRSRPSRALIERWLAEVGAQPSIRSAALHHAGFSLGRRPDRASNDHQAHPAQALFHRLLTTHDPFPAFLFDASWFIRDANRAARWLMSQVMPGYLDDLAQDQAVDMIQACAHPLGLLSKMQNAKSVGYGLCAQLELEASANPDLRSRVSAFQASLEDRFGPHDAPVEPFDHMTFSFVTTAGRFDFFRFQSLVELPQDITLQSLRAEVSLPLATETRDAMYRADLPALSL